MRYRARKVLSLKALIRKQGMLVCGAKVRLIGPAEVFNYSKKQD